MRCVKQCRLSENYHSCREPGLGIRPCPFLALEPWILVHTTCVYDNLYFIAHQVKTKWNNTCSSSRWSLGYYTNTSYCYNNKVLSGFDYRDSWNWLPSREEALSPLAGFYAFKISCLRDSCEIQSLFSKNNILLAVGAYCRIRNASGWQGTKSYLQQIRTLIPGVLEWWPKD